MRQPEAEEEAARRNREDPRRDRFVFYALDESAGIAADAWEVAMRLRRDDERPRTKPRARRAPSRPPTARESVTAVIEPELVTATPAAAEWDSLEPATEVYDGAVEAMAPLAPGLEPEPEAQPAPRGRRFGLVRLWGVFVVLVGLVFIAAVLVVAIVFRDYTHLGTSTWGIGVAAGLLAVWVGVALARRRD
jgi:hypothetical protein